MKKILGRCALFVVLALAVAVGALAQPAPTRPQVLMRPQSITAKDGGVVASFPATSAAPHVVDPSGRDVTANRVNSTIGHLDLDLKKNEPVMVLPAKPPPPPPLATPGKKYFPGTVVVAVDDPRNAGRLALFKGSLFIEIQSKPLAWNDATKTFHSGLTVGIEANDDSEVANVTFETIAISLRGEGGAQPSRTLVELHGAEIVGTLSVDVKQPNGVATVIAHHGQQTVEDAAEVARLATHLRLDVNAELTGYGLDDVTVTATRLDPLGQPYSGPPEQEVEFILNGPGKLEPSNVKIVEGAASARLTSRGSGQTEIVAKIGDNPDFRDAKTVRVLFPWRMLLLVIAGGTVGGLARGFHTRIRRGRKWVRLIVEGCVTGLLFGALVFAGLVGFIPSVVARSEIGVLAIAGLAGFLGADIIQKAANKLVAE